MSPSNSEPALARNSIGPSAEPIESEDCIEDLKANAGAVYRVEQDVNSSEPSNLSFKVFKIVKLNCQHVTLEVVLHADIIFRLGRRYM